ncbi:uncharacterized protein LOC125716803 isoform X1 [Brienomyrus brachyistius]|uniref:uncharacterized protein LOC125716803 isoform X1 n=1 Tax=Brienomyrus brachyistius TaxID=42636 RepID=UPI0020B28C14|nr:uncharacterized protein LOC125716803 isoform X1 [Brienomyrus brachyistius]
MGHSTKPQVYRLILLFLVFYNEHLMAVNINVTAGNPVTISFKFNSSICIKGIKYANLNKDGIKIDEWPNTQRHWQVNKTHCTATVSITNATATDAGIYYVSLFPSNSSGRYEESAKETLTVLSAVTGSPATSHVTEAGTSEGSSPTLSAYIKVICAFLITTVVLIILLLSWVFLSRRRSLEVTRKQQRKGDLYAAQSRFCVLRRVRSAGFPQQACKPGRHTEQRTCTRIPGRRCVLYHHLCAAGSSGRGTCAMWCYGQGADTELVPLTPPDTRS